MYEETRLYAREINYFCVECVEYHTTSSDSVMVSLMYFDDSKICTWYNFVFPIYGLPVVYEVCLHQGCSLFRRIYWNDDLNLFCKCILSHYLSWKLHIGTPLKMYKETYTVTRTVKLSYWLLRSHEDNLKASLPIADYIQLTHVTLSQRQNAKHGHTVFQLNKVFT